MSEEKENATPTELSWTLNSDGTVTGLDGKGRRLFVKELNALDYYNVSKALGAVASANPATLDMAMIACTVRQIDTIKYAIPSTERDVKLLIQVLDFEGLTAVGEAMKFIASPEKLEKDKADAKNLAGDPISE